MPGGKEPAEGSLLGRLHLLAQGRERRTTQAPEHVGVAPFAFDPTGAELAADEPVGALQGGEKALGARRLEAVAGRRLRGRERPARAREAGEQDDERVGHRFEIRLGKAARRHHAERVAEEACILGSNEPLLACDPHPEGTALGLEHRRVRGIDLVVAQVAAAAEEIVQLVGRARVAGELRLDLGEGCRVEQVAQLLLPEQLAQKVAIERERLRSALGRRGVVLVHVGRHVGEEQRRGERRCGRGLDLDEIELPRLDAAQDPLQRRQVEHVLEALAVGLEHDRERAVVACDLEQALGLEALLPERRALPGAPPRDQQGAAGVLAEAGAEERGLPHLLARPAPRSRPVSGADRRSAAADRPRAGGRRCRRPTRSTAPPARANPAGGRRAPSPRARARVHRTASGCTGASRRSRRGTAPRRSCGRRGRRRRLRPPAPGGR